MRYSTAGLYRPYARPSIITFQRTHDVINYIATFDALLRRHLEWQERVYDANDDVRAGVF